MHVCMCVYFTPIVIWIWVLLKRNDTDEKDGNAKLKITIAINDFLGIAS